MTNLLIAMMNDTYVEVKDQAKLQWMVQMFHIAQEYRSPSRLNVVLLIADIFTFIERKDEADERLKHPEDKPKLSLQDFIQDIRIKFKKFAAGELPGLHASRVESELETYLTTLDQATEDTKMNTRARPRGSGQEGLQFLGIDSASHAAALPQEQRRRSNSNKAPIAKLTELLKNQKKGVQRSMRMLNNVVSSKAPKWCKLSSWSWTGFSAESFSPLRLATGAAATVASFRGSSDASRQEVLHRSALWRFKLKRKLLRLHNRQKMDAEAIRDQLAFLGKARDQYLAAQGEHRPIIFDD